MHQPTWIPKLCHNQRENEPFSKGRKCSIVTPSTTWIRNWSCSSTSSRFSLWISRGATCLNIVDDNHKLFSFPEFCLGIGERKARGAREGEGRTKQYIVNNVNAYSWIFGLSRNSGLQVEIRIWFSISLKWKKYNKQQNDMLYQVSTEKQTKLAILDKNLQSTFLEQYTRKSSWI